MSSIHFASNYPQYPSTYSTKITPQSSEFKKILEQQKEAPVNSKDVQCDITKSESCTRVTPEIYQQNKDVLDSLFSSIPKYGISGLTGSLSAKLQEKYDVQNMSQTDFIDLANELWNAGIISSSELRMAMRGRPEIKEGLIVQNKIADQEIDWVEYFKDYKKTQPHNESIDSWISILGDLSSNANVPLDTNTSMMDRTVDLLFGISGVDTSNRLNANSTGDHVLTDEEISYLQKKYDIDNIAVEKGFISGQKGYDLLQELTEMNVLTVSEVVGMKLTPLPQNGDGTLIMESHPIESRLDARTGEFLINWREKYTNDPVEYLVHTAEWLAKYYATSLERGAEPDDRIQSNIDAKMKIAAVFKSLGNT